MVPDRHLTRVRGVEPDAQRRDEYRRSPAGRSPDQRPPPCSRCWRSMWATASARRDAAAVHRRSAPPRRRQ